MKPIDFQFIQWNAFLNIVILNYPAYEARRLVREPSCLNKIG